MDTNTIITICEAITIICYLVNLILFFRLRAKNDELIKRNENLLKDDLKLFELCLSYKLENKDLKQQLSIERKKLHALQMEYFGDQELAVKLEESAEKFMNGLPEGCENDER